MKTSPSSRDSEALKRHLVAFTSSTILFAIVAATFVAFVPDDLFSLKRVPDAKFVRIALSTFRAPACVSSPESSPSVDKSPNPPADDRSVRSDTYDKPEKKVLTETRNETLSQTPVALPPKPKPSVIKPDPPVSERKKSMAKPKAHKPRIETVRKHKSRSKRKRKHTVTRKRPKRIGNGASAASSATRVSRAKLDRFLANVRLRIERAKFYPSSAKRLRLQGRVRVRFRIERDGRLGRVELSGSKRFFDSARSAVHAAFPVDTKGVASRLPLDVTVTLRYRLR